MLEYVLTRQEYYLGRILSYGPQDISRERSGLDQPKVSRLLRGQLSGFSADRLFAILNRIGHSVEVRISSKERAPGKSHTRVLIG